jgi:hypothetical protein
MQEYLNQMFDEDFVREIMREEKSLFKALHNLFSRLDLQGGPTDRSSGQQ